MVKKECYTKKKKDGSNYTTCLDGQKKKPKRQMRKGKKIVIKKKKPAPKKMSAGKSVLMTSGLMQKIGKAAIPEKLKIYRKIFPKKDMVNVWRLLGMYGLNDTIGYRMYGIIPQHDPNGPEGANGRKFRDMVYNRKGMKRMTEKIGRVMDNQMRTKSNHKYIKEVMSFNGFMIWFYEVGYYLKNIDRNPDADIEFDTPFYDTPDFKKDDRIGRILGLLKSFSSREFLLKMPEIYAKFGGVPNATPKLRNGNISLRMKTTKKGVQASYDDALKFLKNVYKHQIIR